MDEAKGWLEIGCLISFTGIITYKKNDELREVVKMVPLDRMLLETDSPFLAPEGFRGKVCEPMYVRQVAECVASVKGISLEEVDAVTTATATEFFGL
jgi:TatD DNase family protein